MTTAPSYTAVGKQILRDGQHFADMVDPAKARALAIVLNHSQVLFAPEVPTADMDFVQGALWA